MKKRINIWGLMLAPAIIWASCSKDSMPSKSNTGGTGTGTDTVTPPPAPGIYNTLIHISNFTGDTSVSLASGSSSSSGPTSAATVFFSLEDSVGRPANYEKTNGWDLAFGSIYNSFLSGNNGTNSQNNGSGDNAVGGIYIVAQPFDSVINIPADSLFQLGADVYGTDASGAFGSGLGWYFYDFSGGTYPGGDGQPDICYALPNRTVIVRTAIGDYAKIMMISIYQNAPAAPTTYWPAPYFTFDYVIVPKGSTQFTIK